MNNRETTSVTRRREVASEKLPPVRARVLAVDLKALRLEILGQLQCSVPYVFATARQVIKTHDEISFHWITAAKGQPPSILIEEVISRPNR